MRAPRLALGARFLLALVRGYKLCVSPHFYGSCRFVPSCADYAQEAVMRHGALGGSWLALKRLARCHPLFSGGLDPVPTQSHSKRIVLASYRRERSKRAAVGAGGGASIPVATQADSPCELSPRAVEASGGRRWGWGPSAK